MEGGFLIVFSGLVFVFAVLARRLGWYQITPPMAFLVAGAVVFWILPEVAIDNSAVRVLAEFALLVVLFHDASAVRVSSLRHHPGIPLRLLLIGFPLALLATFGTTSWLLPGVGLAGALLIAGALTPTDAGLGAPTILNPVVPNRIRRALNVESGLNDGMATPIVLFALALLATDEGAAQPTLISISIVPVVLALVEALILGLGAAWILDASSRRGWSSARSRAIAVLAIPFLAWGIAELIGANGFITAFVAGMVFGARSGCLHEDGDAAELLETGADLLSYAVWLFAGGLAVVMIQGGFRWQWLVLAVLALTVLRVVPVIISLIGSGLQLPSMLFIGWFGPRGLATIVFALLTLEDLGSEGPVFDIVGVTMTTVVISVFAHGMSAQPLARQFGHWARNHSTEKPVDPSKPPMPEPVRTRGRYARIRPHREP
ncbi:MAG: cation:proton antiporter [Actinomycetia bacterium]|nr:cation:proton antiporter [Actinomycetes bacterium]